MAVEPVTGWPRPDALSYVQLAEGLAQGNGYRVDIEGEPEGSRYPPGFPILLAGLSPALGAADATLLLAVCLVVAAWWSAWKAAGPIAATVAVVLIAYGFLPHDFAGAVMADVSGALFVVLALLAYQYERLRLAGALAGYAVWLKLALVPIVVGLRRRSLFSFVLMVAVLAVTKVFWGWGYGEDHAEWGLKHVWSTEGLLSPDPRYPNVVAYPLMLLGVHGDLILPGSSFLAGWAVWHRAERRYVLGVAAAALVVLLPYFYQATRFIFPVAALVAIYSGVGVEDLIRRMNAGQAAGAATGDQSRVPRRRM